MTNELNKSPPRHTPGPWLYDASNGDVFLNDFEGAQVSPRIATVNLDNCASIEQTNADGHIIAAAPDLLEALEAITNRLDFKNSDEAKHYSSDDSFWLDNARAAIAKARGQA